MTGLPPLRDVIRDHGLRAKKALGQNFLLDLNLTSKIARCADDLAGSDIIEVGPGPGGLTRALLAEGARRVHVIERDERCLAALAEIEAAFPGRLNIIGGDALMNDLSVLGDPPRRIVANLPYNIATPLLLRWLSTAKSFSQMVLMFQSEVADRLTATPGTKAYGRLSIAAQWRCEVCRAFTVPASAFTPSPKIESAIVVFSPRPETLAAANAVTLERVTALAFGQRRKMLRSSLKPLDLNFDALGIDPQARAEELTVEQFCTIARAVEPS